MDRNSFDQYSALWKPLSPSSQRAWIEILDLGKLDADMLVALLAEGVDRNPVCSSGCSDASGSPSSQRAWIEIICRSAPSLRRRVALLAEGVDRNGVALRYCSHRRVALLAEGVDRNKCLYFTRHSCSRSPSSQRAWIEIKNHPLLGLVDRSPSSQRAWIEISPGFRPRPQSRVALLAEGVDRNTLLLTFDVERDSRPPRRGRG